MHFKRVMLINPRYKGHYSAFLPAGLGYVAEALSESGIQYDYVDMGLDKSVRKLRDRIRFFSPDLIALQVMTYAYKNTYELIREIKKMFPYLPIVAGGHHISTLREAVLIENEAVDYGVVLEGDRTLVELCRGDLHPSDIKGLISRKDGKILYNGDRDFIKDVDALPFPRYRKFELSRYPTSTVTLTSSRGCPYSCIYCPVKLTIGKQMRVRGAGNVVDEMEYWYRQGYRRFGFSDDNFTFYKERVHAICNEIEQRKLSGLELLCGNGVRADKVDRKLLARMKQVGFTWLAFGVEAGNNKILDNLKKSESIETIEEAIKDACELGFDVNLFFIIGSPGETEADIHDSLDLALRYPVANFDFYNLIPFPGTELYDWVRENNYFIRSPEEYLNDCPHWKNDPVFETPELPYEARRRMFRVCRQAGTSVKKAYFKRSLPKNGILADLLSNLFANELIRSKVLTSTRIRKRAKELYAAMTGK